MQPKHKQKSTLLEECPLHERHRSRVTPGSDSGIKTMDPWLSVHEHSEKACWLSENNPAKMKSTWRQYSSPAENAGSQERILKRNWTTCAVLLISKPLISSSTLILFGIIKAANLEPKKTFSPMNLYPSTSIKNIVVLRPWAREHMLWAKRQTFVSAIWCLPCWGVPTKISTLCYLVLEALKGHWQCFPNHLSGCGWAKAPPGAAGEWMSWCEPPLW